MSDTEQDELTAMTPAQRKLFDIRMKMNAGRKANKKEVVAEHDRIQNIKKDKKENQYRKREERKMEFASDKAHLNETAEAAAMKTKITSKKEKRKAAFGWDVFNEDSLYKGYKKRLVNLPTAEEHLSATNATAGITLCDEVAYGKDDKVEEANVERMAQELEHRVHARKKFSRRRQHYEGIRQVYGRNSTESRARHRFVVKKSFCLHISIKYCS
ncbi:Cyclin D-interacting protein GCIP [Plasmopara halstedii]|uniref:Pre-mRNA-splicing factor SYF2 n=1 Tax=Plasmopara halstedii TaxID=4781 RepID=A0A0P1A4B3_PLAHL|nr:Cyclin D-interacting protein GCIP [Plasmopara halstedii]CEG35136.1 Cyclin D-interacting protein GCIP [Plasmopara halstedii]|eukprot:XP_024571505.1 Cyclin D-interacting protein GCIP [Plasmopara halstedii]